MPYSRDYIKAFCERIRDERLTGANTATRVGTAFLMLLEYLAGEDTPFLRRDQPETLTYLMTLLAGAVIGESRNIVLNPDGSITCGRIHVQGSAIFDELVFNKQEAVSGTQVYSDRGVIEQVQRTGTDRYTLTFRKEHDNDTTTFQQHDCLRCVINRLDRQGTFFTSWFRVLSVDYANNTADVILYPGNEVPGGENYAPVEGAVVSRWGNPVDTDRQNIFVLSAPDGVFMFLQGVTKPIINDVGNNTSAFVGLPTEIPQLQPLVREGTLHNNKTVMYAQTLIAENFITMKHDGTPDYQLREWDSWNPERQYIRGYDAVEGRYVQDAVWHGSSLWKCIVAAARVGVEPSLLNTDWACVRSAGLVLDIVSSKGDWFNGQKSFTTVLVASVQHGDLVISTDDIASVVWTRESGDDAADAAWNLAQSRRENTVALTVSYNLEDPSASDIPVPWRYGTPCGFRCTLVVAGHEISNSYDIS